MLRALITSIFVLLLLPLAAVAQNPTKWSLDSDPGRQLKAGQRVTAKLKADIEPGWHLYALDQPAGGPIATSIKVAAGKPFELKNVTSPTPKIQPDPNFIVDDKPLETKFFENSATFALDIAATADTNSDAMAFDVRFQLCNDSFCLPPRTKRVSFAGEEDVKKTAAGSQTSADSRPTNNQLRTTNLQPTDLWSFLWLAVTFGAISLLTPCVFP